MRVGDLTKNCIFQSPSGSPVVWTTIFTCKGQKRNLSGTEGVAALQLGGIITGTLWIRWRPVRILPTYRVTIENKNINIVSVLDTILPEGRFFAIKIKEVA